MGRGFRLQQHPRGTGWGVGYIVTLTCGRGPRCRRRPHGHGVWTVDCTPGKREKDGDDHDGHGGSGGDTDAARGDIDDDCEKEAGL